jgi:hypothetical protein
MKLRSIVIPVELPAEIHTLGGVLRANPLHVLRRHTSPLFYRGKFVEKRQLAFSTGF